MSTVVDAGVSIGGAAVQVKATGNGPGIEGGGPPNCAEGRVAEISAKAPHAARQGSETRRIRRSRVR